MGHTLTVAIPTAFAVGGGVRTLVRGPEALAAQGRVYLRPSTVGRAHALGVLAALEADGWRALHGFSALAALGTRGVWMSRLAAAGVPVVPWLEVLNVAALGAALEHVRGPPAVLVAESQAGTARVHVRGKGALRAAAGALLRLGGEVLLQGAVAAPARVLVVGGRALAAVGGGGPVVPVPLGAPLRRVAVAAAGAAGLKVAGVDTGVWEGKPVVTNITAAPALEAVETLCGVDAAGAIMAAWAGKGRREGRRG